ncbi:two-partner secretion domain-containing protein [Leptolyngbya iicbica]|uniref:Filamentous hemagglutinin N-terminal domain-containing protein n=2 Tax=Cyanophyceae TaxID=3028117 RepID=A0A4Q7E3Z1_9CYAN|nr:filamentous hemagglutinin N-terminal domain-containing protein [Leptolyngbya sp. LK]RZM76631.1 filamentous hemagglutinin N-terminal domain-containing protein [Leptolyngbya sp. LK]
MYRDRYNVSLPVARCFTAGMLASFVSSFTLLAPAQAQLIPDDTLGVESSVVVPNGVLPGGNADLIEGGAARGSNLFHSFQDFNVGTEQAVYFANPVNIENILTRVTGGNGSNIDGLLGVDGAANLFLLNPNGVIFGPNARLDIGGSFITSTGSSFTFADGSEFSAVPTGDELLSVSVPLGVQFNDQPQGNVTNEGILTVGAGASLTLWGDTVLSRGALTAAEGTIQLAGNQVNLVDAATVDVSGIQGGQVVIRAAEAALSSGLIDISGTERGGDLQVYATQNLTLGIDVDATGGGQALFDPPTLDINAPEAATIVATLLGGNAIVSASEIININAAIDSSAQGNANTLTLDDENGDNALTINLNAPIQLGAAQTLLGDGTTVNVTVTDAGIVQNGVDVAADGGTVNLAAGTYQEGQEILLTRDVTLNGAGAGNTLLDGNDAHRVLQVNGGVTASLNGLTITKGNSADNGGGIFNSGTVSLTNATLSGNSARDGGGIYNLGTVNFTNATLSDNSAEGGGFDDGGGIYNSGTVSLINATLSGNSANSDGGGIWNEGTLDITNVTLSGNSANSDGGGIRNGGTSTVSVTNTILSGNSAERGGGISNNGTGTLSVTDTTLSGNSATVDGGGILNFGTLSLANTILSGNSATRSGGGIRNGGTMNLTNTILSGNSATDIGGGIWNSGTVNLTNATLSGNSAERGGGISNITGGTVSLTNATLSGNSALNDDGGGIRNVGGRVSLTNATLSGNSALNSDGGGIYTLGGTVSLTNATLSGNSATNNGGGINNDGGNVELVNSLIAINTAGTGPDFSGTVWSFGFNLIGNSAGVIGLVDSDLRDIDPRLGPLADNGGPTQTHALLPGSPAINAAGAGATAADQRGVLAIGVRDIGAFEFGASSTSPDTPTLSTVAILTLARQDSARSIATLTFARQDSVRSDEDTVVRFTDRDQEALQSLQVIAGCGDGRFVLTGRGGLPLSDRRPLDAAGVSVPWVTAAEGESTIAPPTPSAHAPLIEAQGVALDAAGQPYLAAAGGAIAPGLAGVPPNLCRRAPLTEDVVSLR